MKLAERANLHIKLHFSQIFGIKMDRLRWPCVQRLFFKTFFLKTPFPAMSQPKIRLNLKNGVF
jgi:hypothetical protein